VTVPVRRTGQRIGLPAGGNPLGGTVLDGSATVRSYPVGDPAARSLT
jgi:hypothetical protein